MYGNNYAFRVPVASSIYPHLTPDETLSALFEANSTLPLRKRLPVEILFLVNNKVHEIPIREQVQFAWTPLTIEFDWSDGFTADEVLFDKSKGTYYMSYKSLVEKAGSNSRDTIDFGFWPTVSSSDLLYRLRCLFPNVTINSSGPDGRSCVWDAVIQHKRSDLFLLFSEVKGAARVQPVLGSYSVRVKDVTRDFITDTEQLLNTLFKTLDGKQLAYFHPAAYADLPAADEHYLAVPEIFRERIKEVFDPYDPWHPIAILPMDFSSFKSLLPDLTYDIQSRKVDAVNGTADLTTVISSSLLFYRLLCHFAWTYSNANDSPPITSVWQVKLKHEPGGASIIFMDDHGLFDIRAERGVEDVTDDLVGLVNALCSDNCSHPYNGLVAGCVA